MLPKGEDPSAQARLKKQEDTEIRRNHGDGDASNRAGCCAQIVLTVSPDYISVSLGDTVTMSCTSSTGVSNVLHWYQQKPGQPPKLLIYNASGRYTGVPERFSGVSAGSPYTNYKLTITGVTADDIAHYYCMQRYSTPLTQ
ncbi:hypothetical protein GDO78_013860 [Eleutherodactylus coqui]|uniref:Ig-like domain-containing protein n=1 Tax=Eleutherodactylus coqui TaxID=57060 RepID=A0A8J6C469_ELECQ|nr:hypothetical protein GDO78_013860 [Eleutherodactylus coqui]